MLFSGFDSSTCGYHSGDPTNVSPWMSSVYTVDRVWAILKNSSGRNGTISEDSFTILTNPEQYGLSCSSREPETSPRIDRHQVLDALVGLFCRPNIPAETLWLGGWLLRQLLPYSEQEFNSNHLKFLQDSYKNCSIGLLRDVRGSWCDLLITILLDEWKKCKKAIETPSAQKDPKCILMPLGAYFSDSGTSFAAGKKIWEMVKVFVLHHQLRIFSVGGALPDQPHFLSPNDSPVNSRAKRTGLDVIAPNPGTEISLVDAIPCKIAFERGEERYFCFIAISRGTSGWVIIVEELPLKVQFRVARVAAPLAGSNPRIDEERLKWLHLRIRTSTLPFMDPAKSKIIGKAKTKGLIDGRSTLAFGDEQSCNSAESMVLEEMHLQSSDVEKRLRAAFDLETSPSMQGTSCSAFKDPQPTPTDSL